MVNGSVYGKIPTMNDNQFICGNVKKQCWSFLQTLHCIHRTRQNIEYKSIYDDGLYVLCCCTREFSTMGTT
jgi:hypothetical protein